MSLCHSRCDSENLQLIKAGNSSSDAECGKKSSSVTAVVVCVLAVFLLPVTALLVCSHYCKIKMYSTKGEDNGFPLNVLIYSFSPVVTVCKMFFPIYSVFYRQTKESTNSTMCKNSITGLFLTFLKLWFEQSLITIICSYI